MDLAKIIIREPDIRDASCYARRVHILSGLYIALFFSSLVGCALLIWRAKLFVTLAQRSNVETLTLAFFCVFFAYLALLSRKGAVGGCRVLLHGLRGTTPRPGPNPKEELPGAVATNLALERADRPHMPFDIRIADAVGGLGTFRVDGVRIEHLEAHGSCSNNAFAFFVEQVRQVVGKRTRGAVNYDIVEWKALDDEAAEKYLSLAKFSCNLARHLQADELWPKLRLQPADCTELERRLAEVCPALRLETLLPDWEYKGEHKLPIIPEPLGLITMSRDERRVDPLASMGAAFVVVLVALALFILMIVFPPWVPGA